MYLKDLLKKEGKFKNPVHKLIAKIIILSLIIFAFNILVNRLTSSYKKETLFESRRLSIENIERNKKTPRKWIAHFAFVERGQQDKTPYSLELELVSEVDDLKLEISLNESVIAGSHIKQKGKAALNIPFDNNILQGSNTIRIRSNRMQWNLQKMALVREKKIVSGIMGSDFRLPNFKRRNKNIYRLEIKLTNRQTPLDLEVSLNGSAIQKFNIKPIGQSRLVLPIYNKILGKKNLLQFRSGHDEWRLDRIDIIEDYGFSRGLFYGAVVKKDSAPPASDWKKDFPSYNKFILLLLLWCLALLLFIPKRASGMSKENNTRSKIETRVKQSLPVGWSILILVSLAIPIVSAYRLVYSLETIVFLLLVPLALLVFHKRSFLLRKKIVIPLVICAAFLVSSLCEVNRNLHQRNFSGLIRIQASKIKEADHERLGIPIENLVMRERGYDGQFFYWIAFDPFLSKSKNPGAYYEFLDNPVYRYNRIGYPLLINIFSLGDKDIFPETMVLLIIFSHLFAAYFLVRIIEHYKQNTYFTFLYLLIPGYVWSLNLSLPESIAGAFIFGSYHFYLQKKPAPFVFCLAWAILVRETVIIFALIFILYRLIKDRDIKNSLISAAALLPLFFWRVYLTIRFFPIKGLSALYNNMSNATLPFYGFYQVYQAVFNGSYKYKSLHAVSCIFPVILTLILFLAVRLLLKKITIPNIALLLYSLLSVSLNYEKVWCHAGNGIRVNFEVFLFLIIAFVALETRKNRIFFYIIFLMIFISGFFYLPQLRLFTFGLVR